MKRVVIVYNPRSSHYKRISRDVIAVLQQHKDWQVAKYEIEPIDVNENAANLAAVLHDGDLVISAGGDGTASASLNGVMVTKAKNVRFSVLGFGNFNDMARSFGEPKLEEILEGDATEVWPLECLVNGKHWRFGMCYFTAGMFAEACPVFDHPKTRHALRRGNKRVTFSMGVLARWWLKCHKNHFLPEEFGLGDSSREFVRRAGMSDYLAVNGLSVARIMKGGDWFKKPDTFLSSTAQLTKFWKLVSFMLRSVFKRVPGAESDYDCLGFKKPANIMVQAEGEYMRMTGVKTLEVRKAKHSVLAVMKKK